jgi:hypothetical protein
LYTTATANGKEQKTTDGGKNAEHQRQFHVIGKQATTRIHPNLQPVLGFERASLFE